MRTQTQSEFAALVEPHRRELQVHCYRMLGSYEDSEDMVQETFLRAWRRRETFQGRSTFRAWLYRIATNACLDALEKRPRRPAASGDEEISWLQPYPDRLLAPPDDEPDAAVVARETIELAFLVAIQHLPPRQRAVVILRDVLDWSARDTAALLGTTVASANSALQRGRATLKERLPEGRLDWAPAGDPSDEVRDLLRRYVEATERGDAAGVVALMHEDARFSMPPEPEVLTGRDAIGAYWVQGGFGSAEFGEFRCVLTAANRMPAVACYRRVPGDTAFRPLALDVLRIEGGQITDITTFVGELFPAFGLPETL